MSDSNCQNLIVSCQPYIGDIKSTKRPFFQLILTQQEKCWDLDKLPQGFDFNNVNGLFGVGERMDHVVYMFLYASLLPKNSTIVEIGTLAGATAIAMGMAVRHKNTKIYAIDPILLSEEERQKRISLSQNKEFKSYFQNSNLAVVNKNIKNAGLEEVVIPVPGTSEEIFAKWNKAKKIDMLFVDGEHTYNAVKIDCQWMDLVTKGGFSVFDDWIEPVSRAAEEYVNTHNEWINVTRSTSQSPPNGLWKTVFYKT